MDESDVVVRIAERDIDPAQRDRFISAVKEEMEESVRFEPGVLATYAVADKDNLLFAIPGAAAGRRMGHHSRLPGSWTAETAPPKR